MNIYILLDRSGSMGLHWDETIGSLNGYVNELKISTNIILAAFDSNGYDVIRNTTAKGWENISPKEISPRGGTPLYDASARMMWRILDDKPEKAIFLVLTDGEENQSRHFRQPDIKYLVTELDKKNYETIFLGANFDKVDTVASAYSRGFEKTANMTRGNMQNFMETSLSAATMRYATGTVGSSEMSFTTAEQTVGDTLYAHKTTSTDKTTANTVKK